MYCLGGGAELFSLILRELRVSPDNFAQDLKIRKLIDSLSESRGPTCRPRDSRLGVRRRQVCRASAHRLQSDSSSNGTDRGQPNIDCLRTTQELEGRIFTLLQWKIRTPSNCDPSCFLLDNPIQISIIFSEAVPSSEKRSPTGRIVRLAEGKRGACGPATPAERSFLSLSRSC